MYEVSAAINNVELLKIPLDGKFQIDMEKTGDYFADSALKLIFICSPNNPTGNLMNRSDIETILKNFNGIVIVDEAYIDFAKAGSLIGLINKYNNLIVSQTFSKARGLASARVGTAFADEEIIRLYNKVKPPYNVSSINQQAAMNALDNTEKYEYERSVILAEKQRLINRLGKVRVVRKIYPSDANFLLLEVDDACSLYDKLVTQRIITRNRNAQVTNCLRITVGTPTENDELINALNNMQ